MDWWDVVHHEQLGHWLDEQPMRHSYVCRWELVMALMANTSRLTNALDMMRHGSSWWSCIHWRLHIMVILEYLTHWGAEVRIGSDFDAVWDAYLGAHLWGVFMRSHLMEMIELGHFGVWWRCSDGCLGGTHFGMGLKSTWLSHTSYFWWCLEDEPTWDRKSVV